ncbi:MAG: adenosine deaminase family protein, partial [Elusimicrobiaceae bacterium]|nr:adenosine deaminase family protein [Elusimicrobiaceae bacterium]
YPHKYVEDLANYIATQRIGIEVCVTSNIQTIPSINSVEDHPVKKMLDYGLSVSICTDNRLISNTSVTRELELVATANQLSLHAIQNLIVAGFKGSFFPGDYTQKRAFVRAVIDRFQKLEKELTGKKKS